jgi:hypothetical protein
VAARLTPVVRIRNRHNLKPLDLLPPPHASADPELDDEKVRAALRRAEAEGLIADKGDVVDGELFCSGFPSPSMVVGRYLIGDLSPYRIALSIASLSSSIL